VSTAPNGERRSGFISGLLVGAAAALAGVALTVELSGEGVTRDLTGGLLGPDPTLTEQARELISESYFRDVSDDDLQAASVRGMIESLRKKYDDEFSHYFSPDEYDDFQDALGSEFEGVGLSIAEVKEGLRVTAVIPDSPAEAAELDVGDVVVSVDGESIAGVPAEVATSRIKGEPGTEVELTIEPATGGDAEDIVLERAKINLPAATGEIRRAEGTEVAYVSFDSFDEGAHGELRSEIERLYTEGAEGLVLDLRGNGGGRLDEAVLAASLFVEDGDVVTTRGRTTGEEVYDAMGEALGPRPTVVLIDRGSASATEILAAAIQSYDLGTIVGEPSFGKGTVQQSVPLPDGSAINLTIAEYLTAEGTSLAGEGVQPEVMAVDDVETERDEALDRALEVLADELT